MATLRLTQDFREFLNLLSSAGIEYLVIGGYAVGLYGYVRPTKDIDLWIAVEEQNLEKLAAALQKFGFSSSSIPNPMFSASQTVLRMGVPPNRIEIISKIAGVEFAECYSRRRQMEIDGVSVPVIDYEDLKRNKLATGRLRDASDVQTLEMRRQQP
jgi:hypothetical protein